MSRPKKDDRTWLEEHLSDLMESGKQVLGFDENLPARLPTYDKTGYWTPLKLICLKYYLPVYLNILCRRKSVGYVDPFSGPGLNLIGKRKIPLPGSPLVPLVHCNTSNKFKYHLFGDTDKDYVDALNKRLDYMASSQICDFDRETGTAVQLDANDMLKSAPNLLTANNINHCLLFVDPEGLQLDFESLDYFSQNFTQSDWMILFPSAGLNRLMGVNDHQSLNRIRRFIGPGGETLLKGSTEEQAIRIFRENLKSLGKDISMEIAITGTNSFHYHLILAVRETWAKSPWFRAWIEAKRRIEKLDHSVVDIVAQQIDGIQSRLD